MESTLNPDERARHNRLLFDYSKGMNWRGDPSTAFSHIKNVAVEPNINNQQSTIKRVDSKPRRARQLKALSREREQRTGLSQLKESSIRYKPGRRVVPILLTRYIVF